MYFPKYGEEDFEDHTESLDLGVACAWLQGLKALFVYSKFNLLNMRRSHAGAPWLA